MFFGRTTSKVAALISLDVQLILISIPHYSRTRGAQTQKYKRKSKLPEIYLASIIGNKGIVDHSDLLIVI
jgi:hypothetical protein